MQVNELSAFFEAIRDDNRISPTHIALFMALFQCWHQQAFQTPVHISRREIMALAKISGLATYHRCIKELDQYGYIRYTPSFHPAKRSLVIFANQRYSEG